MIDLASYIREQQSWSLETFGPGERHKQVVAHIRKELVEIEASPSDLEEWVDVCILAIDGAWRAGWIPEEIAACLLKKQRINQERSWPDWQTAPDDRPIEHFRSRETP